MKRRTFLSMAGAASAAAMTGSLMSAGRVFAQGNGRMTFLTPQGYTLAFADILYAQSGGFYAAEGLDVHVEGGRSASQSIQLVAAKQVDVARTGGANYMVARTETAAPVLAIATIAQVSPFFIISDNTKPIVDPADYIGKTVGMASLGGSMEATLDLMLRRNGLNPADVRRERVADTPTGFGLIEAGRLDGFFGNVSTATQLGAQGLPITIVPLRDGIPGQVHVALEEDVNNRPEELAAFIRGTYNAIQDILAHQDDLTPVIQSMASAFDIPGADDLPVAISDLQGNIALWTENGAENVLRNDPDQWAEGERLLREAGQITTDFDGPLYTNEFWDKIHAG
ncbi:MAG: ABC transporter substrate-binding protein [Paracoccaceae bacterium]